MNPLTREWIEKAGGDLRTARREFRVRRDPNYDAVCFHAQQAVEKYLKAALQESGSRIPRVHSLAELLALNGKNDQEFFVIQGDAMILEGYAAQIRYPGLLAEKAEARAALSAAEHICSFVRKKIDE